MVRKAKLDDIETLILCICFFSAVCGDTDLNEVKNIRKMVACVFKIELMSSLLYWRKDARIFEMKILTAATSGYRAQRSDNVNEIVLERSVLEQLLGKKAARTRCSLQRWSPASIHKKLGEYVVGQDHAKRTIATTVYKHLQICKLNRKRKGVDKIQKANILLIGAFAVEAVLSVPQFAELAIRGADTQDAERSCRKISF